VKLFWNFKVKLIWKFCFILDIVRKEYNILIYKDERCVIYENPHLFILMDCISWMELGMPTFQPLVILFSTELIHLHSHSCILIAIRHMRKLALHCVN